MDKSKQMYSKFAEKDPAALRRITSLLSVATIGLFIGMAVMLGAVSGYALAFFPLLSLGFCFAPDEHKIKYAENNMAVLAVSISWALYIAYEVFNIFTVVLAMMSLYFIYTVLYIAAVATCGVTGLVFFIYTKAYLAAEKDDSKKD